jgi:hypothetical protein
VSITLMSWKTRLASSPSIISWLSAHADEMRPRISTPTMYTSHVICPSRMVSCVRSPPTGIAAMSMNACSVGSSRLSRYLDVCSYWNRHRYGNESSCSCSCSSLSNGSSARLPARIACSASCRSRYLNNSSKLQQRRCSEARVWRSREPRRGASTNKRQRRCLSTYVCIGSERLSPSAHGR